jgi:hypothetical protein
MRDSGHGGHRIKGFILALGFLLLATPVVATTIPASDASTHVGQLATVEGVVAEVKIRLNRTTYIDIGGRYPKQAISGVIFARDASAVGDVTGLSGNRIRIIGTIYLFRGYPEIMITSRNQLQIAH